MTLYEFDRKYLDNGTALLCGVDEAGRGPLAGPVFAAAVILPTGFVLDGLGDSKKLSAPMREKLAGIIKANADYCIASASHEEIDSMNILNATMLAMSRAVQGLAKAPDLVLVDGNRCPSLPYHTIAVVKGDAKSACIAAASILAKTERDKLMAALDEQYPGYGFAKHKGYPTKGHYEALDRLGPSSVHRKTFLRKWEKGIE
ncbi:MAG: ribonuclease HII [Oscillospiraceae bacterium]|nr:ribonuclease HII [Oscillospiraceae bacterium]